MKFCPTCKKSKPEKDFGKLKTEPDGLQRYCKECVNSWARKWVKTESGRNHKFKQERSLAKKRYLQSAKGKLKVKRAYLKYFYGLTLEEHKQMYADQDGKCKICQKQIAYSDIHTDHNHLTGQVRGLLCSGCNWRLGWYEKRKDKINDYLQEGDVTLRYSAT